MTHTVLTIGHSTHAIAQFIALLKRYSVSAVVDVRSAPYSRINPQFNRETLRAALTAENIKYVFLGRELGARTKDRSCYHNGRVDYERLATTKLFREGISRVLLGAKKYQLALVCAEKDPLRCHRTILIAKHLIREHLEVRHILANGGIETHDEAMNRLIRELRLPDRDMFLSPDEIILKAYQIQGEAIAFSESGELGQTHDVQSSV